MLMRRRPIARMAGAAAVGGMAYHAGKSRAEQDAINEQAQVAYNATQAPPPQYVPPPPPPPQAPPPDAGGGASQADQLEQLAALHSSGALTDEEFAKAKAGILGI